MKIICTQEEKNEIVNALHQSTYCVHNLCIEDSCYECIEKSIEWEITDG